MSQRPQVLPPKLFPFAESDMEPFHRGWDGTRSFFSVGRNNHCATICPHPAGALISFYTGREGRPDQRIVLVLWEKASGAYRPLLVGSEGTGNPVLWPESDGATLLFSQFTWTDPWPWASCDLWLSHITPLIGRPINTGWDEGLWHVQSPKRFPARTGLVGRCPPIPSVNGRGLLLPLYNEKPAYGAIYLRRHATARWKRLGTIGKGIVGQGVMQPSLWSEGGKYFALCRNHDGSGGDRRAWYSWAKKGGKKWVGPIRSTFQNLDNSILVIPAGHHKKWIVWNDDGRRSLSLMHPGGSAQRLNVQDHASYPNGCWIGRDLHLVWTEGIGSRFIVHRIFTDASW